MKDEERLAFARRMRAGGVPVYIGEDDGEAAQGPSSGLQIYQFGGLVESRAFDFHGVAAYIIYATITINVSQFAISRFGLELPWQDTVRWLEDPHESDDRSNIYRFGGKGELEFERTQVLNHFANVQLTWSRGKSLDGCLLGTGSEPIPDGFPHGGMIPAFLIVYDQFYGEYRSSISLWTDRTEKAIRRTTTSRKSRKGRLLDHPDPGFEHALPEKEDEQKV